MNETAQSCYRMPAEWEPHQRVWVCRPHNGDTWPNCLHEAQRQFDQFVEQLQQRVEVIDIGAMGIATDDSWIRDYGPMFVRKEGEQSGGQSSELACCDFRFNNWGAKYASWSADDAVSRAIAQRLGITCQFHDFVLEGGAIDVNGEGTLLTTELCLLDPDRNADLSRDTIEILLHQALGIDHIIWLAGGLRGDDTGGHIDDVARFIGPRTVVAVRAPKGHADHNTLEQNWQLLRQARDQDGQRLQLIELPAPALLRYDYPPDTDYDVCREQLPASYANFFICNQTVFVPVFIQPTDATALDTLQRAMPGYRIVPVACDRIIVGLGAVHCLTLQQPS